MAQDATGTPTSLGIPTYNTAADAPSGKGFNAAMAAIDLLLAATVSKPSGIVSGEVPVWNGSAFVRSSVTGITPSGIAGYPADATKFLRGDGAWAVTSAPVVLYDSGFLGGAAASIDSGAGGFSTAFTHLRIRIIARGDTAALNATVQAQFNGDTTANYDAQIDYGQAATPTAAEAFASTSAALGIMPANTATASKVGIFECFIPFYSQTSWHKQAVTIASATWGTATGTLRVAEELSTWRNTAAISRVVLLPSAGNFVANSRMIVYGEN